MKKLLILLACLGISTSAFAYNDADLEKVVRKVFDLRPAAIVEALGLKYPGKGWCYADTAAYGHFGRDIFPWEKCDKGEALLQAAAEFPVR